MRPHFIAGICFVFFANNLVFSQISNTKVDPATVQIHRTLADEAANKHFNGVLLAAENGKIAYLRAFGDADVDGTPLKPNSVFRLASVSKAFTGMGIAILRDEGKLRIDDDVREHIPEFPYPGITIRHLLHHTSGLPDYVSLLEKHWDRENKPQPGKPDSRKIARSPDALRMLIKHKPPLQFEAGEKYEYSNTGYITLGLIVQRVSGKPFGQFLRQRIFRPLGMSQTVLFNPMAPPKINNRAFGFREEDNVRERNDDHFLNGMFGDGEVYSTAEDLLKWDQALYNDKLVSKQTLEEIFEPGNLNNGSSQGYGFGWGIEQKYGDANSTHRVVSHGGAWIGFRTWIERDVDAKRTLIILTNNTSNRFEKLKKAIQPLVFKSPSLILQEKRQQPWTKSSIRGRPEPPPPYRAELAFPNLQLKQPVTLTNAPNTTRLFVAEVKGTIQSFRDDPQVETVEPVLDLLEVDPRITQLYGITFHPEYPAKPYLYVCYVLKNGDPDGTVISRFTVKPGASPDDTPVADPKSEQQIIRWLAGGHNGCCLKFGPDGYLYVSAGDGTGPNPPDILRAGQDLTNVLSTIMRVDVNKTSVGANGELRNYAIPDDNPFVDHSYKGKLSRPEIYAFGFRNPWKFSFDRLTGDLWVGDVGWDMWELVFRVEGGGNYGWSIVEGSNPIHPKDSPGPGPIIPPVIEHHHSEARSVTGGFVYRGSQHPELVGAYIYGDYNTGKIWALRYDGRQVLEVRELTDTPHQIIGWCETNAGELYYADYQRTNQIYRLVPNAVKDRSEQFPRKLSDTGLFASVADHQVAPGVEPYSINAPMWEDGLVAERYLALPGDSQIDNQHNGNWQFPPDSVAMRTLYRTSNGQRYRLETQLLHRDQGEWRPYSYVWNNEQTDATLVPLEGVTREFRSQQLGVFEHQIPSRVECRICHSKAMQGLLGLTQQQLGGEQDASEEHRISRWEELGLFARRSIASVAGDAQTKYLVDPHDKTKSLDERARSYLHVNCVACHRPGGGGPSPIHLDFSQTLANTKLVGTIPIQGDFRLRNAKIVAPGEPFQSVLLYRMTKIGPGHMPHIGAKQVDVAGVRLLHDWIRSLPLPSNVDEKWSEERIREMLATPDATLQLALQMHAGRIPEKASRRVVELAVSLSNANEGLHNATHVRDLLEPFFPASARKERLGTSFDPSTVLALKGNAERGRQVFHVEALRCVSCHAVGEVGGELGPSLDDIGRKYKTPEEVLETLVNPSAKIAPDYSGWVVVTTDGEMLTGRIVRELPDSMILWTVDGEKTIKYDDIEVSSESSTSMMPTQLLQSLSPQEAADLVAFLRSLRGG